jgi:hypothetical protein
MSYLSILFYFSVFNYYLFFLEAYTSKIYPEGLDKDPDFLKYEMMTYFLNTIKQDQGYAMSEIITEEFFYPEEMGNFDAMVRGLTDVSMY